MKKKSGAKIKVFLVDDHPVVRDGPFLSDQRRTGVDGGRSVRTAETHREHLSRKLNIMTVSSLTKYAIQQ